MMKQKNHCRIVSDLGDGGPERQVRLCGEHKHRFWLHDRPHYRGSHHNPRLTFRCRRVRPLCHGGSERAVRLCGELYQPEHFWVHDRLTDWALTPIAGSPFRAGNEGPYSLTVDPSGKFAYVANNRGYTVSGYMIDSSTGALTKLPSSPFHAGKFPISIAFTPQ